jgi:hypothetical protein
VEVRFAVIVMLAMGCYEAPDYSGARFKCDAEHACPAGQDCINGLCGGGGSNMIDSGTSPQSSVACGSATCGANQKCCMDFLSSGLSCLALGAMCNGLSASCDGKEDCSGGGSCCGTGTASACAATCTITVCREPTDCPASSPVCCFNVGGTMTPWGQCHLACP